MPIAELRSQRDRLIRAASTLTTPDGAITDRAEFDRIMAELAENREALESATDRSDSRERFNFVPSFAEYHAQLAGESRAMGGTSGAAGEFIVAPPQTLELFDRLRPMSIVLASGVPDVETDRSTQTAPGIGTSFTANMVPENGTIPESDLAFVLHSFSPRKLAILGRGSREWFEDTSPAARDVLSMDLLRTMATKLDQQCLQGSGVGAEILGIRQMLAAFAAGQITELDAGAGNGKVPDLDDIADAIGRLEQNNATANAIWMHPRTWKTLRKLKTGDGEYYLAPDPTVDARRSLFGLPVFLSSQISITETVGSATNASWIAVLDTTQLLAVRRQDVRIQLLEELYAASGQIGIVSWSRWDFGALNFEAIEIMTGVIP